ncbi:MAG: HD domain-containing protein, partial [Nitrosarchaeum sp.]|nr:HD domain-containing protein [Nitrosarchaeum sp.]
MQYAENTTILILDFFHISVNLKKIPRQGWIDKLSIDKPESVADHTFSMAIMGMIFSDLENHNTEKILKMILLHDLAESTTGDIPPEQISKEEKTILENNTMKKILNDLPLSLQKQYDVLWEEYQSNNSKEAKIVHQLDKL